MKIELSSYVSIYKKILERWNNFINKAKSSDWIVYKLWVWFIAFMILYKLFSELFWYSFFWITLAEYATYFVILFFLSFVVIWFIFWEILNSIIITISWIVKTIFK